MKKLRLIPIVLSILFSSLAFLKLNPVVKADATDDISSVDFVKNLGIGYNLGNTLNGDAKQLTDTEYLQSIYKPLGFSTFELFMEARDLPTNRRAKTNENIVNEIYNRGFRAIRLPVSWSNHMDDEGNISEAWMARVKEITDMFLAKNGVSVILTLMESPLAKQYGDKSYNLSDAYFAQSNALVSNVWRQVATTFKDYGNNLIFENMNEPQYDADYRWNFYFTSSGLHDSSLYKEANENLMALNQTFVNTVRNVGGKNANRFLTVNTIGNAPELAYDTRATSISKFELPNDTATDKIIFNAHAYCPHGFTYYKVKSDANDALFTDGGKAQIDKVCSDLKTNFVDKGIGCIISEWGSVENTTVAERHASRVEHARYYMEKATLAGIAMYTWDGGSVNANEGGEAFGFLNRFLANGTYKFDTLAGTTMDTSRIWYHVDVLDAIFEGYDNAQDILHPVDPINCSFVFVGDNCTMNNSSSYVINSVVETKITPKSGYTLPETITVVGAEAYTYDQSTGAFRAKIKNNMVVMCNAIKVEPIIYDFYFVGENCSMNNKTKYEKNQLVTVKITPYTNFELPETIKVQGSTDYTYNNLTGELQIKVTADTVVMCIAKRIEGTEEEVKYSFNFIGDHCYLNNGNSYKKGTTVNFIFTVDKNYELPDSIVVKGVTDYTYSKTNKTFSCVMSNDVIVVANAVKIVKPVTVYYSLKFVGNNCVLNNFDTYIENELVSLKLTANTDYKLPDEVVCVGGSDFSYNKVTGDISIKMTSDVVLVATATKEEQEIIETDLNFAFIGDYCTLNNLDKYEKGTSISLKLVPDEGYKLPSKINVVGATNYLYNSNTGTIEFTIKNDIVLIAIATKVEEEIPEEDPQHPDEPIEPEGKDSDKEKSGCGGSIVASSIVLSIVSLAGLILVIRRKKVNK